MNIREMDLNSNGATTENRYLGLCLCTTRMINVDPSTLSGDARLLWVLQQVEHELTRQDKERTEQKQHVSPATAQPDVKNVPQ